MSNNIHSTLTQQVANLEKLATLLEKELHLISSRDAESLMVLLDEKSTLLEEIQLADKQIEALYQKNNNVLDEDAQALMNKANSILGDCKYRTEVNQKAVEQGQLRLTHLRNLMLDLRAKESLTYDKSGKPNSGRLGSGISA